MDDFLKMDVFFAVTTGAVIIMTALVAYALVYAIRILKAFERIMEKAEQEADRISDDIQELRTKAKEDGLKLRHIVNFFKELPDKKRSTNE